MNNQPQQQPTSITKDALSTLGVLLGLLNCAVLPLRLYSCCFGTVGASIWFPGLFIAFVILLLITTIAGGSVWAWYFAWHSLYVWLAHVGMYLYRHWRGENIHPYSIGYPLFGSTLGCDITFASLFAILCYLIGDAAFAAWWVLNLPLAFISDQLLTQRDFARLRAARGMRIEAKYRANMFKKGRRR